jgi:hypothetical protein
LGSRFFDALRIQSTLDMVRPSLEDGLSVEEYTAPTRHPGWTYVRPPPQDLPMRPSRRRLLRLVLGFVLCAWGVEDALASPSSSSRSDSAVTSGHQCGCERCPGGETCCCGPRKTRAKPATSDSDERPALVRPGPCLNAAPCSDPVLPDQGVRVQIKPMALMAGSASWVLTPGGRWQPSTEALSFISPFAARLDDPPEVSLFVS